MGNVDLDKARAARAETNGNSPTVTFGGTTFDLPSEFPFVIVELVRELRRDDNDGIRVSEIIGDISRALFRDRYKEFLNLGPSMLDIQALLDGVTPEYGLTQGESPASES